MNTDNPKNQASILKWGVILFIAIGGLWAFSSYQDQQREERIDRWENEVRENRIKNAEAAQKTLDQLINAQSRR